MKLLILKKRNQQKHHPLAKTIASLSTTSSSLNSLFRVLFIFPSWYLFTIGFPPIFSLGWSIPPFSGCTFKQPDSLNSSLVKYNTFPHWSAHTGISPSKLHLSMWLWAFCWPCFLLGDSKDYNSHSLFHSKRIAPLEIENGIKGLGFSLFTRRYSGNHCCFLFLRLLRCFNSAGVLARFDVML